MLYYFLYPLTDVFSPFNVFRYITFRAAGSGVTAFLLSLLLAPVFIKLLRRLQILECPDNRGDHKDLKCLQHTKQGVPTMGGLIIVASILISSLLWADIFNRYILVALFSMAWLALLGFIDDALKLVKPNNKGLAMFTKLAGQLILGFILAIWIFTDATLNTCLEVPFLKDVMINLGILYFPFVMLIIVSTSNAVNLTDGLDGLAIGCTIFVTLAYGVFSYITGHATFSNYLNITFIPGTGELFIMCAAMIGAAMGFLWFNSYPATVFMGDTGSLALGGVIGTIAVLVKKELLLIIVGGVFVIEALSVVLQVASYRFRGVRIFRMAPLHHHFQLQGISESKITIRAWIVSAILVIISLATLKLR